MPDPAAPSKRNIFVMPDGRNLAQSAWVQFAHYLGYFLMALPSGWLATRLGYKGGIVTGLLMVAVGGLWFIPATHLNQFWAFLLGVCIIAAGLTFLETVANPYTTVLGDQRYAATRINLAQSFNGIGWLAGPFVGGLFFYGEDAAGKSTGSAAWRSGFFYTERGDGKALAEGKFGAWILGEADIDMPLDGIRTLQLETRTELSKRPTLFWANARIVTRGGREILLRDLPGIKSQDAVPGPARMDADYSGGPIKIAGNLYATGVPAEPARRGEPATVSVPLDNLDAVRFKAVLGSDYLPGPEEQRRKVYAIRAPEETTAARFLTIIEPFEDRPVVRGAQAAGADGVRVTLADGRVQEIIFGGLDGDGENVTIKLIESRDGRVIREENTAAAQR